MPGNGSKPKLSGAFLTKSLLEKEEGLELKACLLALMSIDLPLLTVHALIEKVHARFGGEGLRIVISSKPRTGFGKPINIWGLSSDYHPQGNIGSITQIDLDVNVETHVAKEYQDEYRKKKKDLNGWTKYFKKELESIRENALEQSLRTLILIDCLTPPQHTKV